MKDLIRKICEKALNDSNPHQCLHGDQWEKNRGILRERFIAFSKRRGPRIGDYIKRLDGKTSRLSVSWEDTFQSGSGDYYLGDNGISFSGSCDTGIIRENLERIPGHCNALFWFFKDDFWSANNGVSFSIPVRVYQEINVYRYFVERIPHITDKDRWRVFVGMDYLRGSNGHVKQYISEKKAREILEDASTRKWGKK
jgi:hypothetical protein